ncbi:hypothetical protein JTP67_37365, partial [Streptomyces sp. S12]|nr:hypothetical protein [Streptomyces sp. S12]
PTTVSMHERYGESIYSSYGFLDSFNPSFNYDIPLKTGRLVPNQGWVSSDYIGIDQGPILTMITNYRNEFVWNVMKRNAYIRTGLERAGFKGGWLAPADSGKGEKGKDGKDAGKDKQAAEAKPAAKPDGPMDPATARALGEA